MAQEDSQIMQTNYAVSVRDASKSVIFLSLLEQCSNMQKISIEDGRKKMLLKFCALLREKLSFQICFLQLPFVDIYKHCRCHKRVNEISHLLNILYLRVDAALKNER